MAWNEGSSLSSTSTATTSRAAAPVRPTITLPPRTSMENLFMGSGGGIGASPGPMTLVSSFFNENDPDTDCRSFSQLLAGAISSPAARQSFNHQPSASKQVENSGSREKDGGGGGEFRFQQSRPDGLVVTQPSMFTIPPGLSPATLLDSPGFFSTGAAAQGSFGMSHQQVLAQVTAQAQAQAQSQSQTQAQMEMPAEYPSFSSGHTAPLSQLQPVASNAATHHQMLPPPVSDPNTTKESSDISHSEQRSQASMTVDKPADDGYNWRKYGQKQVKGSEFPRSYYKCTHQNCPVKKKVERSHDGQVTEIIYKNQHNHEPPQLSKRAKDAGNSNGTMNPQGNPELSSMENSNKNKEGLTMKDQESSQATHEHVSGSSESEEVGDTETGVCGKDDEEPESKRRNIEVRTSEPASSSSHRTVTESRIIVQTTSEVDLLDDGYRWRKYGQKVVKGNPYPRSYYKCTNPGCNVRKHVERAASDPKAVLTTYEGKHNHDVPAAKNSSHNTASMTSQFKPHNNLVANNQPTNRSTEFRNDQQQIALLRFKEEQIT